MSSGNGENAFGVSFGRIMFLEKILSSHDNVEIVSRHDDIIYDIRRISQGDFLSIACVEEYSASLEFVMDFLNTFPSTNIIFVGGKWNNFTSEAKEFCEEKGVGICNAGEISALLRKDKFWI